MIELYHAGVSTCSQKVRLALAETGVITFGFGPHDLRLQQPESVCESNIAATPDPAQRARPRVAEWLGHVLARPSNAPAVEAWLPEPLLKLFRSNRGTVWEQVQAVAY